MNCTIKNKEIARFIDIKIPSSILQIDIQRLLSTTIVRYHVEAVLDEEILLFIDDSNLESNVYKDITFYLDKNRNYSVFKNKQEQWEVRLNGNTKRSG